jgi:predicted nucleotidyltransferase
MYRLSSTLKTHAAPVCSTCDSGRSDLNFLVECDPRATQQAFDRYFDLREDLVSLFGRPVDLIIAGAVRNYGRAEIDQDGTLLYAA